MHLLFISFLQTGTGLQTKLLKHIDGKVSTIASDELQNLYLVKSDVLEKYDLDGKYLCSYNDNTLGPLTSVDAGDPMKVMVFYRPFEQFVLLDNTLTVTGDPVSLENYGYEQVSLACMSYDKGYWFYNPANLELVHMSVADLSIDKTTGNISQLVNLSIKPNFLLEQNNKVFLNDPENGIFLFDIYGTYYKTVGIKGLNQFQVNGDKIIYLENKVLKTYNIKTFQEDTIPLPDSTVVSVRIEKQRLFVQNSKGVDIYEVK
jgi:hypothetical protein